MFSYAVSFRGGSHCLPFGAGSLCMYFSLLLGVTAAATNLTTHPVPTPNKCECCANSEKPDCCTNWGCNYCTKPDYIGGGPAYCVKAVPLVKVRSSADPPPWHPPAGCKTCSGWKGDKPAWAWKCQKGSCDDNMCCHGGGLSCPPTPSPPPSPPPSHSSVE